MLKVGKFIENYVRGCLINQRLNHLTNYTCHDQHCSQTYWTGFEGNIKMGIVFEVVNQVKILSSDEQWQYWTFGHLFTRVLVRVNKLSNLYLWAA